MRLAIDSVQGSGRTGLVVAGWREKGEIVLLLGDKVLRGATVTTTRADLPPHFGEASSAWGFVTLFVTQQPQMIGGDVALGLVVDGQVVRRIEGNDMPIQHSHGENASFDAFTKAIKQATKGEALEIGSRARSGNVTRSIFPEQIIYSGLDIAPGPNVDIVGDAHDLPDELVDRFDFVYSVSTFEHLMMPWKAALEMNKVMKLGGLAYIQSHASWPIHEEPWDYFRFSKYAWQGLFNLHTGFELVHADHCIKAYITPEFVADPPMKGIAAQPTYLLSACLARKVGHAKVQWNGQPSEIANLAYNHA